MVHRSVDNRLTQNLIVHNDGAVLYSKHIPVIP